MREFLVLEDVVFFGKRILKKGETIKIDKEHQVSVEGLEFTIPINDIISSSNFEEIINNKEIDIEIIEVSDEEDLQIKNFRIQLDIQTNRKKAREIESILRKTLKEFI